MSATLQEARPDAPESSQSPGGVRGWARRHWRGIAVMAVIGGVLAIPVISLLISSFRVSAPGQAAAYGTRNWTVAFESPRVRSAAWTTLQLGLSRTAVALVIAVVLSWLIARTDMLFGRAMEVLLWLAFFVPPISMTLGWILLLDPASGLLNEWLRNLPGLSNLTQGPLNIFSFWGIIVAHISTSTVPFMTILLVPAFRRMGVALEEAAHMCGASRWKTARYITIPLMSPAIIGAAILVFIYSLKAFEVELLLGTPVGIRVYSTQIYEWILGSPPEFGVATALGVVFVPILIMLAIAQRLFIRSRSFVTVSGHTYSDTKIRLGRWRPVATILAWLFVVIVVMLPLAASILGSFMRRFGFFGINDPFTAENWGELLGSRQFVSSLSSSLQLGVAATVVGLVVYSVIAYIIVRSRLSTRGAIDVLAYMPVAIPGILLGLALLWLAVSTPLRTILYGSLLGLTIAIVISHMAIGTQQMKAAFMQVSADHEMAARTCGATPIKAYLRILLPLIAPSAIAAAILIFNAAIKDISTVTLLSTGGFRPLAVMLLERSFANQREQAAALGALMSAVTVTAGILATWIGTRRTRSRGGPQVDVEIDG